jgi:hypothetical protein
MHTVPLPSTTKAKAPEVPAPTSSLAGRLADRDRAVDLGLRGWVDQQRGAERGRRQHREAVISVRGVHAITRGFWLPRPTGHWLRQRRAGEDFTRHRQSELSGIQGRRPSLPPPPARPRVHVREQWPGPGAGPQVRGLHAFTRCARLPRRRPRRRVHAPVDHEPASPPVRAGHDSLRPRRAELAFNPHSKSGRVMTPCHPQQHGRSRGAKERQTAVRRDSRAGSRPPKTLPGGHRSSRNPATGCASLRRNRFRTRPATTSWT